MTARKIKTLNDALTPITLNDKIIGHHIRVTKTIVGMSLCGVRLDGITIAYSDLDIIRTEWFQTMIMPRRTPSCTTMEVIF